MTRNCDRNAVKAAIASGMPAMRPTGAKPEVLPRDKQICDQCGALVFGERWHIRKDDKDLMVCSLCREGHDKKALFRQEAAPRTVTTLRADQCHKYPSLPVYENRWQRRARIAAYVGWRLELMQFFDTPQLPAGAKRADAWHDHATEQARDQAAKLVTLYRSPIFFTKAEKRRDWHQDL